MNRQEIIDSWNAQADEYNQWDDLGEDEKLEWAMQMEREAIIQLVPGGHFVDPQWLCDTIRERGNT